MRRSKFHDCNQLRIIEIVRNRMNPHKSNGENIVKTWIIMAPSFLRNKKHQTDSEDVSMVGIDRHQIPQA